MSWGNHKRPLNTRQQKFVEHYLITGMVSEAAIRAGYSPASAWSAGSRLKRNPKVAYAIRVGRANEARRAQIAHERVLLELARIAFSDIGEVLDWTGGDDITLRPRREISPHQRAAIAEITPGRMGKGPRIKLHNKARALDTLARHLGLFEKQSPVIDMAARQRDMRDARTILLERLARLKRPDESGRKEQEDKERAAASLNTGAPLGIPPDSSSPRDSGDKSTEPSPRASRERAG